jgi:hypothetical protein
MICNPSARLSSDSRRKPSKSAPRNSTRSGGHLPQPDIKRASGTGKSNKVLTVNRSEDGSLYTETRATEDGDEKVITFNPYLPEDAEEGNWYDVLETDSEGNITRVAVDDRAPDLQDELPRQYANERGKTIEWNGVTYE